MNLEGKKVIPLILSTMHFEMLRIEADKRNEINQDQKDNWNASDIALEIIEKFYAGRSREQPGYGISEDMKF